MYGAEPPGGAALLTDRLRLAERIGRQWPNGISTVETLSQNRHDL